MQKYSNFFLSWKELDFRWILLHGVLGGLGLPEIYVASRQPLQSGYIQNRELVPCQTEPLHASELLQDRGDTAETVERQT